FMSRGTGSDLGLYCPRFSLFPSVAHGFEGSAQLRVSGLVPPATLLLDLTRRLCCLMQSPDRLSLSPSASVYPRPRVDRILSSHLGNGQRLSCRMPRGSSPAATLAQQRPRTARSSRAIHTIRKCGLLGVTCVPGSTSITRHGTTSRPFFAWIQTTFPLSTAWVTALPGPVPTTRGRNGSAKS